MRWEGTGVGRKKDLINKADLVFTAAGNVGRYQTSRQKLKSAEVNHRLLDCSDAHYFSDTDQLNRIGNCNTWIKADPTFEGLKFAIVEFEDRVEIDDTPEKLRTVKDEPSKYIDTVSIRKRDGTPIEEKWFNAKIPLNNGLVSIIGEKGSGKSALVDIIALLGNSQADSFSFLNEEKFRHRDKGKADGFEASLLWHSGTELGPKKLDEDVGGHQDERVKYIGQEFFDKVCDEIKIREGGLFDQEVKSIVFSHIPEEERLGENSFENLIGTKTESIVSSISDKRESLRKLNNKISDLEIKTDSRNIEELENKLDRKREE